MCNSAEFYFITHYFYDIIYIICTNTAYTMAKYGMSMCVLGMAEEFNSQIGVNALWPRTGKEFIQCTS